jgi:hypothetical protein
MRSRLERRHKSGALAALYLLWLATWFADIPAHGPDRYTWDQAAAAAVSGLVAFRASRRVLSPYPGFLIMQGLAFLLQAGAWLTYQGPNGPSAGFAIPQPGAGGELTALITHLLYASCVFVMMCAWGYLALERWHDRPLSMLTTLVFATLMAGLGAIFAGFYYHQYRQLLHTALGRLGAVTAALEFAVLVTGLLCMLLREPPNVVWMLVGTVILMAGGIVYSVDEVPPLIEAMWMLGEFVVLSAVIGMPESLTRPTAAPAVSPTPGAGLSGRSGLSGILLLVSLGAVLLSPLVWFLPVHAGWKPVFSVFSIVALVTILVWITDRFDDTIAYLPEYVQRVHRSQLVSDDWRSARPQIGAALRSTGLAVFLDEFRDSAARLKQDVLFLGPERLYRRPRDRGHPRQATCFIVMPFSEEWSPDVHRILARACEAAGVRPVRGDDLFTPSDILEDMWQSINASDFVIADITGRNPNVFYELGIAHTLAKPVLILSKQAADIPIDLATRRVILYGQKADAWREELARTIGEAIAKIVEDYGITAPSH